MKLKLIKTIAIVPTSPFNFDATFHKPDHFTSADNHWEPGVRWQTWRWHGKPLGLVFRNLGTANKPRLGVEVYAQDNLDSSFLTSLTQEINYRYNLTLDLSDFYSRFAHNPILGPVLARWSGLRPGHSSSLYEYLLIGIVLQNATVKRSAQMLQNLLEHYGTPLEFADHKLQCFWIPGALRSVSKDELRSLKVGYRAKSIKKIDDHFAAKLIVEDRLRLETTAVQKETLLRLYGVGPATVWYLLFDVFHHWDCFEHISPWEQKIYSKLFFDVEPETPVPVGKLLQYIDKYAPYQHLAVHYLWEDLWWQRQHKQIPWLEKLIRL
jgi:3-methyladenine DNA glycosylase/8-oxoguanine DNA glycosylase